MDARSHTATTAARWRDDRLVVALTMLLLVPLAVACVSLASTYRNHRSWGDNAVIELSVRELPSHPPLVGQVSRLVLHSPGPAMFYFLAPFYFASGQRSIGLHIGVAVLNAGLLVALSVLAFRRGGRPFALLTLAGLAVMVHTLGVWQMADPWNPYLSLLALPVCTLLAWDFADGDDLALGWFVLAASFAVQAHTGIAVALGLVAVAGVIGRRAAVGRLPTRRSWRFGAIVFALLWVLPILDVVLHPPGNLLRLVKFFATSKDHVTTVGQAQRAARYVPGVPPSFITGKPSTLANSALADLGGAPWPLGLVVLAIAARVVWRRSDNNGRTPLLLAVALAIAPFLATWRLIGELYGYVLLWLVPASFAFWLCIVWTLWRARNNGLGSRSVHTDPLARMLGVALIGVIAIMTAVSTPEFTDAPQHTNQQAEITTFLVPLEAALSPQHRVAVAFLEPRTDAMVEVDQSLVLRLVADGYDVITPGQGKWYGHRDTPAQPGDQLVIVGSTSAPASVDPNPAGQRVAEMNGVFVDVHVTR